ncbi:hypothetical protein ES332_D13G048500v1 [Gossypium tomentosum]|uniref:BHLH domain-containing protein n=1 Tax=Gossypium tomentosum TaxID=34277 RepID=A0A5D2HSY6_GOSTO|nr:hypothetical protein ES332_D13G048500v1 [Gossypium tomentosum]
MMAETEADHGFEGDQETATTTTTSSSFSQLLFGGGHDDDGDTLGPAQSFNYTCSSFAVKSTPKMLCFGGCHLNDADIVLGKPAINAAPKAGLTCSDSSSTSSGNNTKSMQCRGAIVEAQPTRRRTNKRSKVENPTTSGHAKVRKEKIGDRINALQQLVSPFGKTDTASVLHEAMGYIRFLHDQVQVLCSPYLQHPHDGENNGGEESRKELKSRGLCLVPVACTAHVENSNGADFWSPATMGNNVIRRQ